MIERVVIKNFKSIDDVTIKLNKFNCFVGMNGMGKSTVLQALDFIAQQMHGDLDGWLAARGWDAKDLHCKTRTKHTGGLRNPQRAPDLRASQHSSVFFITYRLRDGRALRWGGALNRKTLRLEQEIIWLESDGKFDETHKILEVRDGSFRIGDDKRDIPFDYQGSILSLLKKDFPPAEIQEFRDAMLSIRSLELLSPHLLRKRSRTTDRDIGVGGEKLSGYLNTIKGDERDRLIDLLKKFYPRMVDFKISSMRAGWKRLLVTEDNAGIKLETEAIHLNDGLLRILAVLAQENSAKTSMIMLDEVENGINPEIVELLVDQLVESKVQIIVTTHSPMILNYLDDETAQKSVQYVYKSPTGQTRVRPFFDIPRMAEKLSYMGPGEAFVDTNLSDLIDECLRMDNADLESEMTAITEATRKEQA